MDDGREAGRCGGREGGKKGIRELGGLRGEGALEGLLQAGDAQVSILILVLSMSLLLGRKDHGGTRM